MRDGWMVCDSVINSWWAARFNIPGPCRKGLAYRWRWARKRNFLRHPLLSTGDAAHFAGSLWVGLCVGFYCVREICNCVTSVIWEEFFSSIHCIEGRRFKNSTRQYSRKSHPLRTFFFFGADLEGYYGGRRTPTSTSTHNDDSPAPSIPALPPFHALCGKAD